MHWHHNFAKSNFQLDPPLGQPQEFVVCGPQWFMCRRSSCRGLGWVLNWHMYKCEVLCTGMKFKTPVGPAGGHLIICILLSMHVTINAFHDASCVIWVFILMNLRFSHLQFTSYFYWKQSPHSYLTPSKKWALSLPFPGLHFRAMLPLVLEYEIPMRKIAYLSNLFVCPLEAFMQLV